MTYVNHNFELADILDTRTNGVLVVDKKGVIVYMNDPLRSYLRLSGNAGIGMPIGDLIPEMRESVAARIQSSKVITGPRLKEKKAPVVAYISPTLKKREGDSTSSRPTKKSYEIKQLSEWIVGNEIDLSEFNALKEELENAVEVTEKAEKELYGLNLAELREQEIVVKSKAMLQVFQVATKLANIDASHILITGESGTGKGILAKFIHNKGAHASQPFIQINCAAVPENLLEAELFGYEKGAFTGAGDKGKAGLIELAHEGTLFLDEIGDMPMRLQAKLLKYLDDHEVMRLGSVKARKIDCSIVSATNQDLEQLLEQKRFRQDLYFRLNNF